MTCLTTLTPATCHNGSCFSSDLSQKFSIKLEHSIHDIFGEEFTSSEDENETKKQPPIEPKFHSFKDKIISLNELQMKEIIHENCDDPLLDDTTDSSKSFGPPNGISKEHNNNNAT